jgi:hypothetical protein
LKGFDAKHFALDGKIPFLIFVGEIALNEGFGFFYDTVNMDGCEFSTDFTGDKIREKREGEADDDENYGDPKYGNGFFETEGEKERGQEDGRDYQGVGLKSVKGSENGDSGGKDG